jgi:hypothetical protein
MGFGGSRKDKAAIDLEGLDLLTADDILSLAGGVVINEDAEDNDFRVESQTNTHALIVDASSSKVGINKSVPHLPLHVVKTATSASGAYASTPCMILEDATRPGLQIVGNAGNIGIIQFGDNASSNPGEIYYDHGSDQFNFRMGGTVWAALTNGRLQLGTPGGTPGSQQLHVTDAAATSPTYAPTPTLILEDDTRPGIQIVGSANNIGLIQFGDNASSNPGEIYYDHSANSFSFRTAGSVVMTLDSGGDVAITGMVEATSYKGTVLKGITAYASAVGASSTAANVTNKTLVVPANTLVLGDRIQIRYMGSFTASGTPAMSITVKVVDDDSHSYTVFTNTNASAGSSGVHSGVINLSFALAVGSTGRMDYFANGYSGGGVTADGGAYKELDTTTAITVSVTCQFDASHSSNTFTLRELSAVRDSIN